jgi:hypothetical protein
VRLKWSKVVFGRQTAGGEDLDQTEAAFYRECLDWLSCGFDLCAGVVMSEDEEIGRMRKEDNKRGMKQEKKEKI